MKDREYFVLAVIVALIVPIVFGIVYFRDMSMKKGSNDHIAKLEASRELLTFGKTTIDHLSEPILDEANYEDGDVIEFEVDYASGTEDAITYNLRLTDIRGARKVSLSSISWRLFRLNEKSGKYDYISDGTFLSTTGSVSLIKRETIERTGSKKYKLYYYLNKEIKDNEIYARVTIE